MKPVKIGVYFVWGVASFHFPVQQAAGVERFNNVRVVQAAGWYHRQVRSLLILLSIFLASGFALSQDYKLKAGDQLRVLVPGYEEYTLEVPVVEDGTITGPGFGRILVAGKTIGEAERLVRLSLKKILKDPIVYLVFKVKPDSFIYVVGGKGLPGQTKFQPGMTIPQLLANIEIQTPPEQLEATLYENGASPISIPLAETLRGNTKYSTMPLKADDVLVLLPSRSMRVWFTGAVREPGKHDIIQGATLSQGLAEAGGIAISQVPGGNNTLAGEIEIVVRRGPDTKTFGGDIDPKTEPFKLEAGDVVSVVVPELVRVTVAGNVMRAGEISVKKGTSLASAISTAGGPSQDGTLENVLVFRHGVAMPYDIAAALRNKTPLEPVEANDLIVIQPNERFVYALGEVMRPGKIALPDKQKWTATDVLAQAGGTTNNGTLRRVTLLRTKGDGTYVMRQFNLDEFLKGGRVESNPITQPGDVLYFGQPKGITFGTFSQLVSSALLLQSLANTVRR